MNKKFFLSMFAAAGMLFATSCSNDELNVVQSADEAQVTFTLGLEGGIATRAISDGESADVLMYAVFDENGKRIETIQKVSKTGVTFPTTENITLAKGQTYKVAFWAQDDDCEAYTVSDDMKVTVNYAHDNNKVNNDETRDAFFKTVEFTVTGSTSIDVEMKRPFAQINVGVTKADWDAAVASGIEIENSSVIIKNAATSLNLLDGTVGNETVAVSYALNAIPNELLKVDTDGDGVKEEYNWLSMSYILPADQTTGYEKTTLENVAFVFDPKDGNNINFTKGLNSVPVQRNWRTNILGKVLTGDIQFNISINPIYDGETNYPDGKAQELELAAKFGGAVTLTEDVVLTQPLEVVADMVLNLNGKTISSNFEKADGVAALKNSATLTITGGTIKNTAVNGAAAIRNTGNLTLNNVTIEGAPIGTESYPEYAVYTSGALIVEEGTKITSDRGAIYLENGADVTINGGEIMVTDAIGSRVLTAHVIYAYGNSSKLTINDGSFELRYKAAASVGASVICPAGASIDVYGGTFIYNGTTGGQSGVFQNYMGYGAPVDVYGGTYNDNTVTKSGNLADGYVASANADGTYTVTVGVAPKTVAELQNALDNAVAGSTIVLPKNITEAAIAIGEMKDVIIDGADNTKVRFVTNADSKIENVTIKNIAFEFTTGAGQAGGAGVVINKDAQIENLVIENSDFIGDGNKNSYGVYGQNSNASIKIQNCKFLNLGYAIQAIAGGGYKSLVVDNCTFDNIISWAILPQYGYNGDLTINGCTFNNSKGGLVKTGAFNGSTFTFTNNTITNSTGHDGNDSKWFDVNASTATKIVAGNTVDGAAWNPAEAQGLK